MTGSEQTILRHRSQRSRGAAATLKLHARRSIAPVWQRRGRRDGSRADKRARRGEHARSVVHEGPSLAGAEPNHEAGCVEVGHDVASASRKRTHRTSRPVDVDRDRRAVAVEEPSSPARPDRDVDARISTHNARTRTDLGQGARLSTLQVHRQPRPVGREAATPQQRIATEREGGPQRAAAGAAHRSNRRQPVRAMPASATPSSSASSPKPSTGPRAPLPSSPPSAARIAPHASIAPVKS